MTTYPKTADALRKRIARDLGPIADRHWQIAERRGQVTDVLFEEAGPHRDSAEQALRDLVTDLREAAQEPAARPASGRPVRAPGSPAFAAAVQIAAIEAAVRPDVVGFRRDRLPDGLLDPVELRDVVDHWRREQGPPAFVASVIVTGAVAARAGGALGSGATASARGRVAGLSAITISIPGAQKNSIETVPVAMTGPLADLRDVAGALAAELGWPEVAAVVFVLTGITPRLRPGEAGLRWRRGPGGSRVQIEAHPSVPAARVAALHEAVRARVGPRKPVGLAGAALAVFVAEMNDGRGWPDAFAAWCRRHKGTGGDWRAFRRAAVRSYRSITGRDLVWNGRRGRARKGRRTLPARPAH